MNNCDFFSSPIGLGHVTRDIAIVKNLKDFSVNFVTGSGAAKILKKLNYNWASNCFHLSYGMVELPEGKMKSREGTVVDADELLNSVINEAKSLTSERGFLEELSEEEILNICKKIPEYCIHKWY